MFRNFSQQVIALPAHRSGHDRFLSNSWHFNIHASSSFSKPRNHVHTTGNSEKHLSLVDSCHFVGTVHFYKHLPVVRIPMATANVITICCSTIRDSMLCSHYMILLDKQASDVRRQSAPSAVPPAQTHESLDHDHNAQAHLWKMYGFTN